MMTTLLAMFFMLHVDEPIPMPGYAHRVGDTVSAYSASYTTPSGVELKRTVTAGESFDSINAMVESTAQKIRPSKGEFNQAFGDLIGMSKEQADAIRAKPGADFSVYDRLGPDKLFDLENFTALKILEITNAKDLGVDGVTRVLKATVESGPRKGQVVWVRARDASLCEDEAQRQIRYEHERADNLRNIIIFFALLSLIGGVVYAICRKRKPTSTP